MDNKITLQRILILDDDSDYRKLLLTWLGSQFPGVEVVEFDPQNQGLPGEDFDWAAFDVLLLDYNIRSDGATGLDILSANYNNDQFPSTILLTGAGSEDIAVRAFKYEVTDYMRKEWLDKEQLRAAVDNAFYRKILKHQRLNLLDEARQVAMAETELVMIEFKKKYAKVRELEQKQVKLERQKAEKELQKNQALMEKVESDRAEAEKTKNELMKEIKELKAALLAATDTSGINDKLESTHQKLEEAEADISQIKHNFVHAKAALDKSRWQQDQGIALQKQLEDDLALFNEDLQQQDNQSSDVKARVEIELLERMIELKKRKINEMETDEELVNDISSQLHKDDK